MKIMSTRKISAVIEDTIESSKEFVLIISPYLKISDSLYERIIDRLNVGTRIILLYGKIESNLNNYPGLKNHENISIYYLENLHAKIYANDHGVLLTSMNLHSYSEINNWELGAYFEYGTTEYEDIIKEIYFMLKSSKHKYGINEYAIIKLDSKTEKFIELLSKKLLNMELKKFIIPTFNDQVQYSIMAKVKNNNNLEIKYYGNMISILCKNNNEFESLKHRFSNKVHSSDLRVFEKKLEFTIYPPDGFNARTSQMTEKEIQDKWIDIFIDIDNILEI